MISAETLVLFCVTAFALIIVPGPNMIYIITRSTSQGRNAGLLSTLGVDVGTLIHVIAASLGLSALLVSSALVFSMVKYLGAAYLIYLGFRTWFSKADTLAITAQEPASAARIFFQGTLTNVLNPKVALFFLAFLPQFVDTSHGNVAQQILLLGIIFTLIGLTIGLMIALLASSLGDWLRGKTKVQQIQKWITGGVYISLGISTAFAVSDRK
ncbi:MAG: LysE family translocator [Acidobacteriota bacterium]